jgi:hypothetical protein
VGWVEVVGVVAEVVGVVAVVVVLELGVVVLAPAGAVLVVAVGDWDVVELDVGCDVVRALPAVDWLVGVVFDFDST